MYGMRLTFYLTHAFSTHVFRYKYVRNMPDNFENVFHRTFRIVLYLLQARQKDMLELSPDSARQDVRLGPKYTELILQEREVGKCFL